MSVQEKKSFFSTIPGIVTGAAGLLTGVVGLLTVSTQLGWIGDDGDGGSDDRPAAESTATTARPGAPASGGASATAPASLSFTATPQQLTFGGLGSNDQRVTVRNTGGGPLRLEFSITGANRDQFRIAENECASRATLAPNLSCTVQVSFQPTRVGEFTANLAIEPATGSSPPPQEIALKGSRLL